MPLSEFSLIERYFAAQPYRRDDVRLGIGDDAAVLKVPAGHELVVAVDTLLAGVHFPHHTDPVAIGHKALAVNLSDMAAMGATPAWCTLSLSLPEADEPFVAGLAEGLFSLASQHGVALVGGDTVRGPLALSLQVMGLVPEGEALRRSGARPGDLIYVSGSLGDAGAGLAVALGELGGDGAAGLRQRLDRPTPRVALGEALRGIASAAIDISDGLLADLGHILTASGCGAALAVEQLPLSAALQELVGIERARELALGAGDDYELCFTIPPARRAVIEAIAAAQGVALSCIGSITAESGIALRLSGEPFAVSGSGYDHFAKSSDGGDDD